MLKELIIFILAVYVLYKIILWLRTKQKRYIPMETKRAVLRRYFGMCAICPEKELLEFHHKQEYSNGGDNSEKNIAVLCPKHHAMITRNG